MNLNELNANVNRLLQNIWAVITFLKEFCVDGAKDVSITYINNDGSESIKTFPNVAKMQSQVNDWLSNNIPRITIGDNRVGTRKLNIFQYFEGGLVTKGNTHLVTDIKKEEYRTFCFHIQGQMLNEPLALNCMIAGYMYGTNGLSSINSTQPQVSAYINKSGFVTLKITSNPYYGSFTVDSIIVGNGGHCNISKVQVSELDL